MRPKWRFRRPGKLATPTRVSYPRRQVALILAPPSPRRYRAPRSEVWFQSKLARPRKDITVLIVLGRSNPLVRSPVLRQPTALLRDCQLNSLRTTSKSRLHILTLRCFLALLSPVRLQLPS